ncbi:hypothetical protein BGZ58_003053 [Dissophora ornata]|nr:hypothetical protein BGZ58_003053 [Dissophora ornata]
MEHLELPFLRAFVPIVSNTGLYGFYGLNGDGQVLRFSADLTRLRRSQIVSDARDDIAKALGELERISEQARRLEAECQLENQRIANYNRLVHELQQCILSQSNQDILQDPQSLALPVRTALTVSVQPVAIAHGGSSSRCRIQLNICSSLNIDWNTGWSAVINVHSDTKSCPHGWSPKIGQHCDTTLGLAGLSPSAAWIHDIDIDLHRFRLPLAVIVGLQFDERDKQSNGSQFGAYFMVESVELDVIHFSEPVRDRSKQKYSSVYHALPTMAHFGDLQNVNNKDYPGDSKSRIYRPPLDHDDTCAECADASARSSTNVAPRPLVFEIDTKEIQVAQCLPALLGDGITQDQVMALVHSAFQASLYVLEEFLPRPRTRTGFQSEKPVTLVQDDSGIVWLTMDVKEAVSGSNTQVSIEIMGADPRRILAVHRALEKRVEDLFG